MPPDLHDRLASRLRSMRNGAGFGPRAGSAPEPEPTALAAIALDDDDARAWLEAHQADDGAFALQVGPVRNDSATALGALALGTGPACERAIDHLIGTRARGLPATPAVPHDPRIRGWGWTPDTFGWVEPTARALLALRVLRPDAVSAIGEAVALLEDRECVGGGWNYGNPLVFGAELPPFVHTTAVATIALQGDPPDVASRGLGFLGEAWRDEPGALSLAVTLVAFELADPSESGPVGSALATEFERTGLLGDVVALAWAAIGTGPGSAALRVP